MVLAGCRPATISQNTQSATPRPCSPMRHYLSRNADLGRLAQGLVDDAIALGQADQRRQLLLAGAGVQVEVQPDALKADGHFFGDAQRAPEIQVALGPDNAL